MNELAAAGLGRDLRLTRTVCTENLIRVDAVMELPKNDALGAHLELKRAFTTDVSPLLAIARLRAGCVYRKPYPC
jgi:L-rhamnose isomerase